MYFAAEGKRGCAINTSILSWKSSRVEVSSWTRVGLSLDRVGFRATFLGYNNNLEEELGGILQRINDLSTTIERSQKCVISQKLRNCKKVRVEVSLRADVSYFFDFGALGKGRVCLFT